MTQYIPKEALLAEIERRMKLRHDSYKTHRTLSDFIAWEELEYFKEEFLPTLEVKEVDLESEMDKFYGIYRKNGITYDVSDNEACFDWKDSELSECEIRLAKHFFELGLKAQQK